MLDDEKIRKLAAAEEMAARIVKAIDQSDLNQAEIAAKCCRSEQAVGDWKRTGNISRDRVMPFVNATKVEPRWLLCGEGPMEAQDQAPHGIVDDPHVAELSEILHGIKDQDLKEQIVSSVKRIVVQHNEKEIAALRKKNESLSHAKQTAGTKTPGKDC